MNYKPKQYWNTRLKNHWDLSGVGYGGYSMNYNKWLYKAQEKVLSRVISKAGIELSQMRILDVGSGIGYWLKWFQNRGAPDISSLEISLAAVEKLRQEFQHMDIMEADITDLNAMPIEYDLVNAMSVLYHVVNPILFDRALENLASMTRINGWLIISDRLGAQNEEAAGHVHFRNFTTYERKLTSLGFKIRLLEPVYTLLNGGVSQRVRWAPPRFRGLVKLLEETFPPAWFMLDRVPGIGRWANMRILAAEKWR